MSVQEDLVEKIADVVRSMDAIPADVTATITSDTNIVRDLRLDSITVMDFIMELETKFDTVIPIDTIAEVETVGDLARMLDSRPLRVSQ